MTIIEALVQLRNDLKLWVANNIRALNSKIEALEHKTASTNLVVEATQTGEDANGNVLLTLVGTTFEEMEAAANAGRMIILKFGIFFANMTFHADGVIIFEAEVEGNLSAQIRFSAEDGNIGIVTDRIIFDTWINPENEGKVLTYEDGSAVWKESTGGSVIFYAAKISDTELVFFDNDFNPIQRTIEDLENFTLENASFAIAILDMDGASTKISLANFTSVNEDETGIYFTFHTEEIDGKYDIITVTADMETGYLVPTYENKSLNMEDVVYYGEANEGEGTLAPEISLDDLMPKAGGKFTGAVEYTTLSGGNITSSGTIIGNKVYGAVWNDYAEFRQANGDVEPGRIVCENGDDTLSISTKRLQPGAWAVSDTYGFAIGETEKCKCPVAVSGRVLVYTNEKRETYKPGDAVCAGPNGTVSKMSRREIRKYPDRIIGTVSSVPAYDFWGETNIEVKNRIWIKVH